MAGIKMFIIFSWGSNNLTNYGKRHFKLFTNCHVSWDILYLHTYSESQIYEYIARVYYNVVLHV